MAKSNVTPLNPDAPPPGKTITTKRRKQVRGKAMPSGLRLDLGCGPACTPGFIGVDRFALDGVSVVADLDGPLPFETETVDYVLASHSLEHVTDLPATMAEIFRICRDRAVITIIGPYHNTGLNRANVYHSQVFNEHTMRFFTERPDNAHIESAEYAFPHADVWGLLGSDHSEHDYDIRVLNQEFFYFAPFRGLPSEMKTLFRKTLNDVCDQMIIHAVVAKSPMDADEEAAILRYTQFAETESLRYRRQLEEQAGQPSIWSALADMPSNIAGLAERHDQLERELVALDQRFADSGAQLDGLKVETHDHSARLERLLTSLRSDTERFAEALREEHSLRESQSEAVNAEQQSVAKRLDEIERQSSQNAEELNTGLSTLADTLAEFATTREWSEAATGSRFDGIAFGFDGLKKDTQRFVDALREEHRLWDTRSEAISAEQQIFASRLDEVAATQSQLREAEELHHIHAEANTRSLSDSHRLLEERFGETERQLRELARISHEQTVSDAQHLVEREIHPSLRFRMKRYLRQFKSDLSGQVAPAYRELVQDSLVENDITKRHQLLLSQFIVNGAVLDFQLPKLTKPLISVETVLNILVATPPQGIALVYDVFDPSTRAASHAGAVDLHSPAGEIRITLNLGSVDTSSDIGLILRLFGSPETQRCGLRTYEWRRKRLTPFGRAVQRKLFATFNTVN